tara:strand:- start:2507 stop:3598 length:1092 start_codon:yes stop_codon:yes gene_type:complete
MSTNKLFFYVKNGDLLEKHQLINLLKEKALENATFCANAYKIIKTGLDINIELPTRQKIIDNSDTNCLIYLDDHNKYRQKQILHNNSIEENFCRSIFKMIKKGYDEDNFDIPSADFNYISNYIAVPIVTFSYDTSNEILNQATEDVLSIINSIIIQSNKSELYNINLSVQYLDDPNTLGYAIWSSQTVVLNSNNNGTSYLNDTAYNTNSLVLLHEVLHILGLVGVGNLGSTYTDTENHVYTGENGVKQYKNLLLANLQDLSNIVTESEINNIEVIPIEDDFGRGTAHVHFEEGYDETNGIISYEVRNISGISHPSLMNEIMSGFLNNRNYLTPLTLGTLEDISFIVDYRSEYLVLNGDHMHFR